jgi:hypothetical protein
MRQAQPLFPAEKEVAETFRYFWSRFRDVCIRFRYFLYTSVAYTPAAPLPFVLCHQRTQGSSLRPLSSEDAGESGSGMTVSQIRDSMDGHMCWDRPPP